MKEFVEKLIDRLKHKIIAPYFAINAEYVTFRNVEKIANELVEEYNNGWIPCNERLPEPGKRYLVSCIVKTGDIEEHTVWHAIYAGARGWYTVESKALNTEVKREVIAWQPLPESYKPQQESEWKDKVMKHFTNVE